MRPAYRSIARARWRWWPTAAEGTVSVFTISGNTLTAAGKVALGDAKSGPSHPMFSRDGTSALVTRDGDNKIAVLTVDGSKVEYAKRDLTAGMRPYQIDSTGNGDVAVVANIGTGSGDNDTISLIDMRAKPVRVVSTVSVAQTPEGLKISPDGAYVAVTAMNGSNKPKASPFYNDFGLLHIFRINGTTLTPVTEAKIGHWCQGIAWSKDFQDLAGAVHGGERDRDVHLRRQDADQGGADRAEGEPGRHPHRRAVAAARTKKARCHHGSGPFHG